MPHGETIFAVGDEIYIAGDKDSIDSLISFADPNCTPVKDIIVVGATRIGSKLVAKLTKLGYNVRLIEESIKKGETTTR